MDIEELKVEKIQERIMDMKEEILHEQKMGEDLDYSIDHFLNDIQDAYDILNQVSVKLFEYGHDIKPIDLLKEI